MNDSRTRRWFGVRLLLCVNLGCLALLIAWTLCDANLAVTLRLAGWRWGWEPRPDHISLQLTEKASAWRILGPRLLALKTIGLLAVMSGAAAFVQLVVHSTLRQWLIVVAILLTWLGFWQGYDQVRRAGVVLQANRSLPRFIAMSEVLLQDKPGKYEVDGVGVTQVYDDPFLCDQFTIKSVQPRLAFSLDFGGQAWRDSDRVRFEINADDYRWIEFHSNGVPPTHDFGDSATRLTLKEAIPLRVKGWYLVKYEY